MDEEIINAALRYTKAGISVLPTGKNKVPKIDSWKHLQSEISSEETVRRDFSKPGTCVAAITGEVSGNLEMQDFDFFGGFFDQWKKRVEKECPGLIERLVKQRTQNGGYHIIYRCRVLPCKEETN